jgi:hypothetical protein
LLSSHLHLGHARDGLGPAERLLDELAHCGPGRRARTRGSPKACHEYRWVSIRRRVREIR